MSAGTGSKSYHFLFGGVMSGNPRHVVRKLPYKHRTIPMVADPRFRWSMNHGQQGQESISLL